MSTFSTLGRLLFPEFHSNKQAKEQTKQAEQISKIIDFIKDHYKNNNFPTPTNFNLTFQNPRKLDYQLLAGVKDPDKCGQLIANLATFTLTDKQLEKIFTQGRFKIIDPAEDQDFLSWKGKNNRKCTIASIAQYYTATNPASALPGIETWKWLKEDSDKTTRIFKESGNCFHLLGTAFYGEQTHGWCTSTFRPNYSFLCSPYQHKQYALSRVLLFTD